MANLKIDGADLWFPPEVELVEVITFIDRRYIGAITRRATSDAVYASLLRRSVQGESELPMWDPHTLADSLTDTVTHAKEMIMSAYEALTDRLGTGS